MNQASLPHFLPRFSSFLFFGKYIDSHGHCRHCGYNSSYYSYISAWEPTSWLWGHELEGKDPVFIAFFFYCGKIHKAYISPSLQFKVLCRHIRCIECHVNAMQLSPLSSSKAFPSPLKETSCPVSSHVPFLSCPSPWQPLTWFPFNLMDLPVLDISHKWKS